MPKLKTIRRFGEWAKDDANLEELLKLIASGTQLQKACLEVKQPYTLVFPLLHSSPELQARYEAALAARAEALVHEALEIADDAKGATEPVAVAAAKLRVETRHRTATWWNRERYGEAKDRGNTGITVLVDRTCGGAVAIQSGSTKVLVGPAGGVSQEREISSTEASAEPAEITQEA